MSGGVKLFGIAAEGLAAVVGGIRDDQWSQPGLGVWDVRGLTGHASRALSTVVQYAADPAPDAAVYPTAERYYAAGLRLRAAAGAQVGEEIAQRGVEAGAALGPDPAVAVRQLAEDAVAAVADRADDSLIGTRFGGMPLAEYLRTRVLELVVHALDLTAATGQDDGLVPAEAVVATLELAGEIAVGSGQGAGLLRALTGRSGLPAGFSVV